MAEAPLPWKINGLDGYSTSSGYTFDGGSFTGGGPWLNLSLAIRWWSRYGEPATVQVDIADSRAGSSACLSPEVARQAAAALLAAADAAEAEIRKWRDIVERQRETLAAAAYRDAVKRAGLPDEALSS